MSRTSAPLSEAERAEVRAFLARTGHGCPFPIVTREVRDAHVLATAIRTEDRTRRTVPLGDDTGEAT